MNRKLLVPGMFIALASFVVSCNEELTQINPSASQNSFVNDLSQATNTMNKSDDDDLKDSYIVVYKQDNLSINALDFDMNAQALSDGVKADRVYTDAIKGYAGKISASTLAKLKKNPNIDYIEKDQIYTINTTQSPLLTWGIDRIDDSGTNGLDGKYTYTSTGLGVDAYIIDTGILTTHQEFEGRATSGFTAIGTSSTDQNGHGTHVAGTVGGKNYGVAKKVNLFAVRVLDGSGSGTTSGVIAGINWAINHHTVNPAVANMSLGGGVSAALDAAVQSAVADGIVMCVAAGNNTRDAINYSPSRVGAAITVGSSGAYSYPSGLYLNGTYNPSINSTFKYDLISSFSNYGSIVDIFAPGSGIRSAWFTSSSATNTISGTSMATPHVTGVAALYLALNPSKTPAQVEAELKNKAKAKVTGMPTGTTNKLLYASY